MHLKSNKVKADWLIWIWGDIRCRINVLKCVIKLSVLFFFPALWDSGRKMHVIVMRTKEEALGEQARKGQRSFFHPKSVAAVTALPACATSVWEGQVSAWQTMSGLASLREERRYGAEPPDPPACSPSRAGPHFPTFRSPSRWGQVREPLGRGASSSKTPEKWGRWPRLAPTVNQPAKGEERGVTEAKRIGEELARRGEGWQGVRCELSRETFVQQIYGVKLCCWVEAGCSYIIMYSPVFFKK